MNDERLQQGAEAIAVMELHTDMTDLEMSLIVAAYDGCDVVYVLTDGTEAERCITKLRWKAAGGPDILDIDRAMEWHKATLARCGRAGIYDPVEALRVHGGLERTKRN
jgi:hypothetical protein